MEMMEKIDMVNNPPHYVKASVRVEPIELTARLTSCYGQALQYIFRAPFKGNYVEDLKKAVYYLRKADDICDYPSVNPFNDPVTFSYLMVFSLNDKNLSGSILSALFKSSWEDLPNKGKCPCFSVNDDSLLRAIRILENEIVAPGVDVEGGELKIRGS